MACVFYDSLPGYSDCNEILVISYMKLVYNTEQHLHLRCISESFTKPPESSTSPMQVAYDSACENWPLDIPWIRETRKPALYSCHSRNRRLFYSSEQSLPVGITYTG